MLQLQDNFVFVYCSTSGEKHSYLMTADYKRYGLNTSALEHPLETGFYTVVNCTINDNMVTFESDHDIDYLGAICPRASSKLNDLAVDVDYENFSNIYRDDYGRFDLCGMLVEKVVPFKGGKKKTVYKVMTLNNVVVCVEVWYPKDFALVPKVGDCIILKDCFFDFGKKQHFLKTRANQGFQWFYLNKQKWFKGVFKSNNDYVEFKEIKTNSRYHYTKFRPYVPDFKEIVLENETDKQDVKFNTPVLLEGKVTSVVDGSAVTEDHCDNCFSFEHCCIFGNKHTSPESLTSQVISFKAVVAESEKQVEVEFRNGAVSKDILARGKSETDLFLVCGEKNNRLIVFDAHAK